MEPGTRLKSLNKVHMASRLRGLGCRSKAGQGRARQDKDRTRVVAELVGLEITRCMGGKTVKSTRFATIS